MPRKDGSHRPDPAQPGRAGRAQPGTDPPEIRGGSFLQRNQRTHRSEHEQRRLPAAPRAQRPGRGAQKSRSDPMNEEEMKELREQMEVRMVALLLGEASAFETAELEEAMRKRLELAAFHAQMRRTIELSREATRQFQPSNQRAT